jgi:hypothetical protein
MQKISNKKTKDVTEKKLKKNSKILVTSKKN